MKIEHYLNLNQFSLAIGETCNPNGSSNNFLGFPHWYQYLNGVGVAKDATNPGSSVVCNPSFNKLTDIWLVAAAIIEILLRIGAIVAVIYVIYGGIQYILSQGTPEQTNKAKNTITNALIGLTITVVSSVVVSFIANQIS